MSKAVTNESSALDQLVQEARTETQTIIQGVQKRATELAAPVTTDLGKLLTELTTLALASAGTARQADATTGAEQLQKKSPERARDDAALQLAHLLHDSRVALGARYGEQIDAAFPKNRIPQHPNELLAYSNQVLQALQARAQTWTPVRNAVQVDLAATITQLSQLAQQLKSAIDQVSLQGGGATASLHSRDGVSERMHQIHKGLLSVVAGLLEIAGEPDRADSIAIHHHVGRPHGAASSTPPGSTGQPA